MSKKPERATDKLSACLSKLSALVSIASSDSATEDQVNLCVGEMREQIDVAFEALRDVRRAAEQI